MIGQHRRTESLFYYFRLEEQIPPIICCESSTATSISVSYVKS